MKCCPKCKQEKVLTEFYKISQNHYDSYCKSCKLENGRKWQLYYSKKNSESPISKIGTKVCSKCKTKKTKKAFSRDRTKKDGLSSWCDDCRRGYNEKNREKRLSTSRTWYLKNKEKERQRTKKWRLQNPKKAKEDNLRQYGITYKEYIALLRSQNNNCAICSKKLVPRTKDCCVDHNHKTGKVQGILCRKCNLGIGFLNDSPKLIRKAADYIEERIN